MFCHTGTHALAWNRIHLRSIPTKNTCAKYRETLGRSPHPSHRTCELNTPLPSLSSFKTCVQNVRVVAEYYTRITIPRLTALLDLTPKQTEQTLARLVVSGTIWAKIDRPAGIVDFRKKRSAEDVMNDWSSDMQKLLGLVEKTWMAMNAAQAAQSRTVKSS